MRTPPTRQVIEKSFMMLLVTCALGVALLLVLGQTARGQSSVLFVSPTGITSGSCNGWATACKLDYAMSQSSAGKQLWLKAGTYTPTVGIGTSASFTLTDGVAIYGGFAGTETLLAQRNSATNVSILSGDLGAVGVRDDNALHVVTAAYVGASTVLDGVTIQDGAAKGFGNVGNGGGIFIYYGSPTIANVRLYNNTADQQGGAIYVRAGNSQISNTTFISNGANYGGGLYNDVSYDLVGGNVVMTSVAFYSNTAGLYGGGLYNDAGSPQLTNVLFQGHSARLAGGAVYLNKGSATIVDTQFTGNYVDSYGAGLYNNKNSAVLSGITFSDNYAKFHGGAMFNSKASVLITNLNMISNSAKYNGGGIVNDTSYLTVTNTAFSSNRAKYGGGMFNDTSGVVLTNATFYSNTATEDGGAMYNDGASPVLTHFSGIGNRADHYGGAIYSILGTPVIRNGILWGNTAEKGGAMIGTATLVRSIVEGGCPTGVSCTSVWSSDPVLGAFGNYGGSVGTAPILTGSAAIDRSSSDCAATDARGIARPQGTGCDLGAYETRGLALTVAGGNGQAKEVYKTYDQPLRVTATHVEGHAVDGASITFSAPESGAATTPVSQTTVMASAQATITVRANGYSGPYVVTARAPGSQPVYFNLDNLDAPIAGLDASHSGSTPVGQAALFTATTQAGSNIDFAWDFGDSQTGNGGQTFHIYQIAGTYHVTVTATNDTASAQEFLIINVYDVALSGLTAGNSGPTVLGATTTFTATAAAGTGLAYSWQFGDGGVAIGASVAHAYAASGIYTATVTAANGTSNASAQTTVIVEQALSGVSLQGASSGEVGRAVSFAIQIGAGQASKITWQFGDEPMGAAPAEASAGYAPWASVEHVYIAPGTYQVIATVANAVSQVQVSTPIAIRDVVIANTSIDWNGQLEIGELLNFIARISEGTSVSCIWDFDDGTPPISGCDVDHTYNLGGDYTVKLWTVNSIGAAVTKMNLHVTDPTPAAQGGNLYLPAIRR